MTFAQWLRRRRREGGVTQVQLAERAGLGRTYVTALEGGAVTLPTANTRRAIHQVLGTSDEELIALGIMAVDAYTGEEYAPVSHDETRRTRSAVQEPMTLYNRANPFDRSDPRWQFVETLKRFALTRREHAGLLVAVAQLMRLLDAPPDTLAQMADVIPATDHGHE